MTAYVFITRLILALVLGAGIGLERQLRHRMAGTRTNALVAAGAAVFTIGGQLLKGDPTNQARVVSYIVAGIGFLGAGVIFKEGANIQGLNTAATVWCSAAVGTLAGMGYTLYAVVTAAAVLLTNTTLRPLTYKLRPKLTRKTTDYQLELVCCAKDESHVRVLLVNGIDRNRLILRELTKEDIAGSDQVKLCAELRAPFRSDECVEQLVARLSLESAVTAVSWKLSAPPILERAMRAA